MSEDKTFNLEDLLDVVQKKWYWITIPFFFFMFLGAWLYVVLPREYEASTVILIQPQEIPSEYVVATVRSGLEDRVRSMTQEVMSRSNLERVMTEMDIYTEERARGVPIELLVEAMRSRITLDVSGSSRSNMGSFTLSFKGRDPQHTADVTNRLASLFIESNLKARARQATETTEFLEKQLADLKALLEDYERKLQVFRNVHMGQLPEQLQSNTAMLSNLQNNLETVQRSLADARNRKLLLQGHSTQSPSTGPPSTSPTRYQRLTELRQRLQDMKANYTPEHPEIRRLMDQIREIESQPAETVHEKRDPQIQAINVEIANLERDAARIKARIGEFQQRVENTPKAEQEMATMQRDYQITQQNYQRLLDRLYEARRAESLEKRQQGEQFRVLDPAQPPRAPVRPNFLRLILVFLVLGLGSGSGLLLMMELMDNTVKGIQQVEELSGNIPCISAVPLAMTVADKNRSRRKTMALIAANIMVVVLGSVIVVASKLSEITVEPPFNLPF